MGAWGILAAAVGGAVAACAPPLPLVVLPPDGVSTLRYARGPVPPKRRAAAIIGFAPFPLPPPPLRRWRRPRGAIACAPAAGFRCAPLCPCCAVSRGSGGGAPLRSGPAPRFWPRGGAILFSLRRVWGLRRLRAALKVYRTARAAQCKCGVHGFAMNPCDSLPTATAPYYREARVTLARRQTACRMRHCCARRIVETGGRRKLGCTSTRWAERQRIVGVGQIV